MLCQSVSRAHRAVIEFGVRPTTSEMAWYLLKGTTYYMRYSWFLIHFTVLNWSVLVSNKLVALLLVASSYIVVLTEIEENTKKLTRESTEKPIHSTIPDENVTQQNSTSLFQNLQLDEVKRYCSHIEIMCKGIKCSCIPEQLDPGEVVNIFIDYVFKVKCGTNIAIKLTFEQTKFSDNTFHKMHLTNVTIEELTLSNCYLIALSDTAFSSTIYRRTKKLVLKNNNISTLKRATFRYLPSLEYLTIENNEIKEAEKNLLLDVADSLQNLHLENSIKNTEVLRNITGASELSKVALLSLRQNCMPLIDSYLFSGVSAVRSLYLECSNIKTIRANAFEPMSKHVEQLVINNNDISTLPKGLFDSIIQRESSNFHLIIDKNPWHCNCSLKWMQDMIRDYPSVLRSIPKCKTPKEKFNENFRDTNFCDGNERTTSETSSVTATYWNVTQSTNTYTSTGASISTSADSDETTTKTSYVTESRPRETIHVKCNVSNQLFYTNYSRHVFSMTDLEISLYRDFDAMECDNGSFVITIPNSSDVFLVWFANSARSNTTSLAKSIKCVGKVKGTYLLEDLQPHTSYTICTLDNRSFSPLNCLGLSPSISNAIDKGAIIAIFVVSLILMCLLSAILMFFTVRQHPTMLRGSKRIVIVKRRTLDAMVLPKGISSDSINSVEKNPIPTISRNLKEDGYVTPLPLARKLTRKNSRSSASSVQSDGTSYISNIEPTLSQLNSWRLKGAKYTNCEIEPPPLPPHPSYNFAQPLSIVADLDEDENTDASDDSYTV